MCHARGTATQFSAWKRDIIKFYYIRLILHVTMINSLMHSCIPSACPLLRTSYVDPFSVVAWDGGFTVSYVATDGLSCSDDSAWLDVSGCVTEVSPYVGL